MSAIDPNAPIAVINGRDINNARFYSLLMEVAGMRVFQQAFDLTLVQDACQKSGIETTGDRFEQRLKDEYKRTLDTMTVAGVTASTTTTDALEKEKILNEVLRRQGVTAIEFRMGLETRCLLRAMAQRNESLSVTDADVDDAYVAEYGERRAVHLVQVPADMTV